MRPNYLFFLFLLLSIHFPFANANETSALIEPATSPIPNTAVLQESPVQPEGMPPETNATPETTLPTAPLKKKSTPVCFEKMVQARPMASGVPTLDSMLADSHSLAAIRFVFGNGDSETRVKEQMTEQIRRLDHAITVGSTNKARHLILLMTPEALLKRGKLPFAQTLENMWLVTEVAALRMDAARRRVIYMNHLKENEFKDDDATKKKLDGLIDEEWVAYYDQAWWFGIYFKTYSGLKSHLITIVRNQHCNGQCRNCARWLIEGLGTRDSRLQSRKTEDDDAFNARMGAEGIDELYRKTKFFEDLVDASNFHALDQLRTNFAETVEIPEEITALAETYGNPLSSTAVELQSLDPYIRSIISSSEKWTQVRFVARKMFKSLPRLALFVTDSIPGGAALRKTPFIKRVFRDIRLSELNDEFSGTLVQMNRAQTLDMKALLGEVRELSASSTRNGGGVDDVLELIASRPDLLDMWVSIVKEVNKADGDIYHLDLKDKVNKWETKRRAGKLKLISAVYRVSPWKTMVQLTALAASSTYLYHYPDMIHLAGAFVFQTIPSLFRWPGER